MSEVLHAINFRLVLTKSIIGLLLGLMMVFVPVPSQTINRGAKADFGREFKTTR